MPQQERWSIQAMEDNHGAVAGVQQDALFLAP